ncbi:MAG: SMC family ATPase [Candidatus Nanoarchaeia archaeon]|nr:SMC family ATPase [Candidatus Nanoarchaeia archaeon]MDD5239384.1 SMC family ATPase [Candidatus Nanoarchaeia archaeon]
MILKQIRLENIRSHPASEIDLSRGISVFTGRTGCGKSTVLMAIEYALFGSECGIPMNAILRRSSQSGKIVLEFEEKGKDYTIIRGLKRSGKNIVGDATSTKILHNGSELSVLERATDINQKILEIIDYPVDIKPKDLFETTSYTRQDEIRALLEMTAEKRQEHIDKILQLSKYKDTWDNMKDVVSFFTSEIAEKKGRLEQLRNLQAEILKLEKKIIETETGLKNNDMGKALARHGYESASAQTAELENEIKGLLEKRRKIDQLNGVIANLSGDIKAHTIIIAAFGEKISELKSELSKIGSVEKFDALQMKQVSILKEIELKHKEIEKTRKEFENILKLGAGKCPVCMQKVTSEHISSMNSEFGRMTKKVDAEIKVLEAEQQKLEPEMRKSKLHENLGEDLEKNTDKRDEKIAVVSQKESELKQKQHELKTIDVDEAKLNKKEKELGELKSKEREWFSKLRAIETTSQNLAEQLEYFRNEFSEKKALIDALEKEKSSAQKLENALETIMRLREDIRNIREVIRRNFLEDFRQEFQRKFEEIRRYEEEYSVDIKQDYEPIAYALNGEEVPITNLSGGEKTSVALAYRLSLADLAAQMSSINPSEILILDEPTTGFDQEDIKSLPPALRNIRTIPQIIIVTHEEELKNAADYKYEIVKESGESKVRLLS